MEASGFPVIETARALPDLLRARAAEAGERVALVVDGGAILRYGEWDTRSNGLARGLAEENVRAGDRVGLLFDNGRWTDFAVAYLGVLKAGAVAVPLSPRFSSLEVERVLEHSAARIVVCFPDLSDLLPAGTHRVPSGDLEQGSAPMPPTAGEGDLAEIVYTSGTGGAPKGVACSHLNLLAHDLPATGPGQSETVFLHAFPIGTNAGQECVRMPLRRCTTAVVLQAFDPGRLCAAVVEHSVRRLQLVPAMARLVVDSPAAAAHDLSSVEAVILSSAPAPPALWARLAETFPDATLFNAYALTEGGGARTLARYDPERPNCVGRPVGRTEVRLAADDGTEPGVGEIGEIWLRMPGAPTRAYFGDPAATAATFVDGWVRTGDIGYLDDEGRVYLVDRKKDVISSGGIEISSVEIEAVLSLHPSVVDAAVFGIPHDVLGQSVAAAVVVRDDVSERDLQAFVRAHLGEHKVPRRVVFAEELPRNASEKVLKRELRDTLAGSPERGEVAQVAIEADVARVWEEILGRTGIASGDDFFDLGGQSIAAAQIAARLHELFEVELPPTVVFEHPTVAELACAVSDALGTHG